MRLEGNARINTPSAGALQKLDIGAVFPLGIIEDRSGSKQSAAGCEAGEESRHHGDES